MKKDSWIHTYTTSERHSWWSNDAKGVYQSIHRDEESSPLGLILIWAYVWVVNLFNASLDSVCKRHLQRSKIQTNRVDVILVSIW